MDGTVEYAKLAADLGCPGVKVRPNGLQTEAGIPEEATLEQIGKAIGECAAAADGLGVQIRVEVHGKDTQEPRRMRAIMDHADHSNAYICWNSNFGEVQDGSVETRTTGCWLTRSAWCTLPRSIVPEYPVAGAVQAAQERTVTRGYTLAEIAHSPEPERLMGYYKALWEAYQA